MIISWLLMGIGLVIMGFGALGTIILPDLFQRFHASTKCGVSGAFSLIIGLAVYSGSLEYVMKYIVIILFLIITSPLIAHMLALSRIPEDPKSSEEDSLC